MNYCLSIREIGLLLKPDEVKDGNPEFKLIIYGTLTHCPGSVTKA